MKLGVTKGLLAVHGVVLAVGVFLSTWIYLQGRAVMEVTALLVERDLPRLEGLSRFKVAVVDQEPILYAYYATMDRQQFLQNYQANRQAIEQGLKICATFPNPKALVEIQQHDSLIQRYVRQLDETLKARDIDWDRARELLAIISPLSAHINQNIDALVGSLQSEVALRGAEAQRRIAWIIGLVALFSGTLFLVTVVIGFYVNRYLAEVAERRRLAMFPERNPHPVLSLSAEGAVLYANVVAVEMAREIGGAPATPTVLFPADLPDRLAALLASPNELKRWEYRSAGRVLETTVQRLRDLGVFHVYLSDITERKLAEAELIHHTYHDPLTGLPNRRMFLERMKEVLHRLQEATPMGVLLLGLDRFERVVDSLGHRMGDQLLQAVGGRLQAILSEVRDLAPKASLYRFEGDVFCVLMPEMASPHAPVMLAERIGKAMDSPLEVEGRELFTTCSIGISLFPMDGEDPILLLKNADTALQSVRQRGGHGFQCYAPEMNARALQWLELENALRHALERGELRLYYQPQVHIPTGGIIGLEALVRWQHPQRGTVSTAELVELAEETGLIVPIGAWIVRQACMQNKAWQEAGLPPLTVAVNLSARQFQGDALGHTIAQALGETGLGAERLELEITESVIMRDLEASKAILRELKAMGVKLAIDDFGTGYSSLSYLKYFPIDKLKIDQSFVRHLPADSNDAAIARAVIALGHSLSLTVLAEGVETKEQLELLRTYGCDEWQGYLFSKPVPAEAIPAVLSEARQLSFT